MDDEAGPGGDLLQHPFGVAGGRRDPCAGVEAHAARQIERLGGAEDRHARRLQLRGGDERRVRRRRNGVRPTRPRRARRARRNDLGQQLQVGPERPFDPPDVDAQQQAEGVAGDVVRRDWRPAGVMPKVRIFLLLQHRLGEGAVRLRERHDPGPGRISCAAGAERRSGAVDLHLAEMEDLQQLVRLERVALIGRDDEGVRRLVPLHPVPVHLVEILQPPDAVLRHLLESGEHCDPAVLDDVGQPPYPLVVRHGKVPAGLLRAERPARSGRVVQRVGQAGAGDLGQDARLPVIEHVLPRRRPEVVLIVVDHPFLAGRDQRRRHRQADLLLPLEQDRVDVRVVRVLERGNEDPGAGPSHLVHVVRHLRLVLAVDLDGEPRLLLREHEPVAVVVVPGVVVVQVGIQPLVAGAARVVPVVDHEHLAVRVLRRDEQHHRVVEDLPHLRRPVRGEPVGDLDDRLPVPDLVRMDRGVEEVERDAFPGQRLRFRLRQAAGVGEPMVDGDQPVEPVQVRLRAQGDEDVRVAVRRRPPLLVPHAVRPVGEVAQIFEDPGVTGQLAVGADFEAEELGRRGDRLRGRRGRRARAERGGDGDGQKQARPHEQFRRISWGRRRSGPPTATG